MDAVMILLYVKYRSQARWLKEVDSMSTFHGNPLDLSVMLALGGSWHNIPGKDSSDFITAALTTMSEPGRPDLRFLVAPMIARETASPTAMGEALAFPHPLADGLGMMMYKPFVAIAYPRFPVAWGAPDGIPVKAALFVVCSDRHDHLLALSALAKHCSRKEVRTALMDEATVSELIALMTLKPV
jgi:nitrogen PTS system EIIA component